MDVRVGPQKRLRPKELMLSNCGAGEDSCESLGQQGNQTSQSKRKSSLNIHRKDWCWSSNTLATWCEEPTHWKRSWFWERLRAGGEGANRRWDGWMASSSGWTWVWANSGRQGRTGKPSVLQSMGSKRIKTWLSYWTTTYWHITVQMFNILFFSRIHERLYKGRQQSRQICCSD